jgi:hypothetical protein
MRYKQSEPRAPGELRELNAKEAVFVEALGNGDDNITAYKAAYGPGHYSPAALRVAACRKASESHIQDHLRALRAVGLTKSGLTLAMRIEDEMAFAQRCEDSGNMGAAGGARERVNRLLGLYVERSEIILTSTPEQTLRELALMIDEEPENIEVRH